MGNTMYLVTGAAGFLGGTICRQLIDRGDRVRAFVLPNDKAIKYVPKEAEIVEGDLCDMESLRRFFTVPEGVETIVLHIAVVQERFRSFPRARRLQRSMNSTQIR